MTVSSGPGLVAPRPSRIGTAAVAGSSLSFAVVMNALLVVSRPSCRPPRSRSRIRQPRRHWLSRPGLCNSDEQLPGRQGGRALGRDVREAVQRLCLYYFMFAFEVKAIITRTLRRTTNADGTVPFVTGGAAMRRRDFIGLFLAERCWGGSLCARGQEPCRVSRRYCISIAVPLLNVPLSCDWRHIRKYGIGGPRHVSRGVVYRPSAVS